MTYPFVRDLAIDLGTVNTCIFAQGRGIVVSEPSIVALNKKSGRIEAVGSDAREMLGRTPTNITAVKPMRDGVIADVDTAEKMLRHFIQKASNRSWLKPRAVIGVPSEITHVERRAVRDSAIRARMGEVHLVEETMAAAVGAGMPIGEASGNMVVDVGGGTTDIAVISLAGVVYAKSVRVAGNHMDDAIVQHMKKAHNLLIGERTAERVKIEIGSAAPLGLGVTTEVKGQHLAEGKPATVNVSSGEIERALSDPVQLIVQAVLDVLETIAPELSADICDRGLTLTGGGALLKNFDKRLRDATGLPVLVADNPLTSVVLGAGKMLSDDSLLRRIALA